ncbi:MAG: lipid A export permease/ATP-binding protein MsbA [Pseudomonadota bacterium]
MSNSEPQQPSPAAKNDTRQTGLQIYLRLMSYVKPYWKEFLLSVIGFFLYSSSQPALAWVAGWLSEAVFQPTESAKYLIPLALIGIYIVRGLGLFLGNYYLSKVSEFTVHSLRCEMFNHQLNLPNSFYDNNNSGQLISRITFNVTQVTAAATDAIKVLLREGIAVIALLSTLFYLNWQLSLIFIAIAPIIAIVVGIASKKFRKISTKIQLAMGDITHVTSEVINGYQEVKSFAGEDYEKQRFLQASQSNLEHNIKMVKTSSINTPILQMIVAMALALLLYIGLSFVAQMSAAGFITYMTAAGLLPKPIKQLSDVNSTIQKGIAAAISIFELLDTESEQDKGTISVARVKGKIAIKNLSFTYPHTDIMVLKQLNISLQPGKSIALVGRSGSGKSTLANLIPRFYQNEEDNILLDDIPINQYQLKNLRSQIALVSQNITLFNDTIANNIAYGALVNCSPEQIRAAAKSAYALEFIEKLADGFNTQIGEDGTLLSGGQRQRIGIARALLKDAPVLILDEATSALDTESEREIQAALEHVMQGRSTLIIAHRLSTIEKADQIIVLDQGQIIETGSHKDLLAKKGTYFGLYQNQFA